MSHREGLQLGGMATGGGRKAGEEAKQQSQEDESTISCLNEDCSSRRCLMLVERADNRL